jgi:hypothetical protein
MGHSMADKNEKIIPPPHSFGVNINLIILLASNKIRMWINLHT